MLLAETVVTLKVAALMVPVRLMFVPLNVVALTFAALMVPVISAFVPLNVVALIVPVRLAFVPLNVAALTLFALTSPVNDALCPVIVPVVERPPLAVSMPVPNVKLPDGMVISLFNSTDPPTVTVLLKLAALLTDSFEHVRSLPSYHPPAFARTQGYVATVSPPMVMLPAETLVTLKVAVLVTLRLVKLPLVPDIVAALIVPILVMSVDVMPVSVVDRFVMSFMECVCPARATLLPPTVIEENVPVDLVMAFYVTPVKAVFIADTEADTAEMSPLRVVREALRPVTCAIVWVCPSNATALPFTVNELASMVEKVT